MNRLARALTAGAVLGLLTVTSACTSFQTAPEAADVKAAFEKVMDATLALTPDGVMMATPPVPAECHLRDGTRGVKWMVRWINGSYPASSTEDAELVTGVWEKAGLKVRTQIADGEPVVRGTSDEILSAVFIPANGSARFTTVCASGNWDAEGGRTSEDYRDELVQAVTSAAVVTGWTDGLPEPYADKCLLPDDKKGVKWNMFGAGGPAPSPDAAPALRAALDGHGFTQAYAGSEERGAHRMNALGMNVSVVITSDALDIAAVSGCIPGTHND